MREKRKEERESTPSLGSCPRRLGARNSIQVTPVGATDQLSEPSPAASQAGHNQDTGIGSRAGSGPRYSNMGCWHPDQRLNYCTKCQPHPNTVISLLSVLELVIEKESDLSCLTDHITSLSGGRIIHREAMKSSNKTGLVGFSLSLLNYTVCNHISTWLPMLQSHLCKKGLITNSKGGLGICPNG